MNPSILILNKVVKIYICNGNSRSDERGFFDVAYRPETVPEDGELGGLE